MSDNNLILHARFIEVDGGILMQILSCEADIFQGNYRNYPQVKKLFDTSICRNPRVNLIPTLNSVSAMNDIQTEINEWLGQSQEVEDWYCRNVGKKIYVTFTDNGAIVNSDITPQSAAVPDFSDDKVVTFEMEGLRVDFAKLGNRIWYDVLEYRNPDIDWFGFRTKFFQTLNEFQYLSDEEFKTAWQKLQAYKQSQESKPEYRVEWTQPFPIDITNLLIKNDVSYLEGLNRGIALAKKAIDEIKIHDLKVWSE